MTTLSVPPMKSEQNEREAFEQYYDATYINKNGRNKEIAFEFYIRGLQHQQKQIDELEERIETHIAINKSLLMQRDTLQAQLTIAVKALEEIRVTHSEDWCNTYALEALAEINKIGE